MKLTAVLSTLAVLATPALAFEVEEIGAIQATFESENISQSTVIARADGKADATAFMMSAGGGFTAFSLAGLNMDNMALGLAIGVGYFSTLPGPETMPSSLEITYSPNGRDYWTSEEAPTPPVVSFSILEFDATQGRAVGTFAGLLCFAEDYGSDADTTNCRLIEGSFDTRFLIEK